MSGLCDACGVPIAVEDSFCPSCGAECAVPSSAASPEPAVNRADTISDAVSVDQPVHGCGSECAELTVRFNVARMLMEDAGFPFDFRITPHCEGLDRLRIRVLNRSLNLECKNSLRRALTPERERSLSVDVRVPAGERGLISFDIEISFRKDGQPRSYETSWQSEVFPREAASIQNLVIDIKQSQGHAGDIGGINMNGVEELARSGKWREVLRELAKIPPQWEELLLEECEGLSISGATCNCRGRIGPLPAAGRCDRFTLDANGRKLHIISSDTIQLGRNRESDVVSRIFDPSGSMPRSENLYISKFHCGLVKKGSKMELRDGSLSESDPKGKTWVNGKRLEDPLELPAGLTQICFGPPDSMQRIFSLSCKVIYEKNEKGKDDVAAVLLKRNDEVPERWLIVYDRIALKSLGKEWDGCCVARHDDGFCFGHEGACQWLFPGKRLLFGNTLVQVQPYAQYGL